MDTDFPSRWSSQRANAWYDQKPWWNGCNFLPSTAVNPLEMWQAETFDPATMARELRIAGSLGFNSVRVFLSSVAWSVDPDGWLGRVERFLALAAAGGVGVMPVLLDDCNFANRDPLPGPQPVPVPGVHNSGWVPSQPRAHVRDRAHWLRLRAYVEAVVRRFREDPRVDVWDVYNEPGNAPDPDSSLPLMRAAFAWTRACAPRQPLTCGPWKWELEELSATSLALSDVVSFHGYEDLGRTAARLASLPADRPVLCTEWMARTGGSTFLTHLPLWRARKIGCWCWGLVAGRTQTFHPWGSPVGAAEPAVWHHDVVRADGTPWCAEEVAFLKRLAREAPAAPAAPHAASA